MKPMASTKMYVKMEFWPKDGNGLPQKNIDVDHRRAEDASAASGRMQPRSRTTALPTTRSMHDAVKMVGSKTN